MVKIVLLKSDADHMHRMKLMHTPEDAFIMSYTYNDDVVSIEIETYGNSEDTFHDLCFMTEWCIKKFHPEKIVVACEASLCKLMNAAGYYAKGKSFQHIIEPYRYILDDHVFDEEGYIIDQGSMQSIPFGWFDTQRKGCGWIAAYNLLKLNRRYTPMHEVIHDLEKHNLLGKVSGQEMLWLVVYLKQKGLDIFVSLPGFSAAMHAFQSCSSGILAYSHARGAHYAMFDKVNETDAHFYNAVYRRRNHQENFANFLHTYTILHGCIVIGVRKKEIHD